MTRPTLTLKSFVRPLIFGLVGVFALAVPEAAFAKKHKHKKGKHYSSHHKHRHYKHRHHHRHHRHHYHHAPRYYHQPYYQPYYSPYRVAPRRGVTIHF